MWLHQVFYRVIRRNAKVGIQPGKEREVISAALAPAQILTVEDSSTSKIFVEHLNAFLSYVISFQRLSTEFYSQLAKATDLGDHFECFISCASVCLKYGKIPIVKQCVEIVRGVIEKLNATIKPHPFYKFFYGIAMNELSEFVTAIKFLETSLSIRR